MDDWIEECMCGHAPDEHSDSDECQVEGCGCACYEELQPEDD